MPPIHTILFSRRAICWNLHHTIPWRAPVHTVVWLTHFHPQRRRCHVDCNAQSLISLHFIISTTCSVILIHCYFSLHKRPHCALCAPDVCRYTNTQIYPELAAGCVRRPDVTPSTVAFRIFVGDDLPTTTMPDAAKLAMSPQSQLMEEFRTTIDFCQSSSRSYRYTLDFRRGVVGAHCLLHRIVGTEHFSIFPTEENTR